MQAPDFCMIRHTAKHPVEYTLFRMSSDNPSRPYNPSLLLTWQCMPTSSGNLNADAHRQCLDTHLSEVQVLALLQAEMHWTQGKKSVFFLWRESTVSREKAIFCFVQKKSKIQDERQKGWSGRPVASFRGSGRGGARVNFGW